MLLEKLSEEEHLFMESWSTPRCLTECLFGNFDDFGEFDKEQTGEVRLYQRPFLSNESLIDFETTAKYHNLSEKEEFQLRKNVGDIINVGARRYGKTIITLRLDIINSLLHDDGYSVACYSIDEKRLRGVLDHVKLACEFHPIIRAWEVKCNYKPNIKFYSIKNRWTLSGVNITIFGKSPGSQWYQLHVKKIYGEEISFEQKEAYDKRVEALSELGAVIRLAGMTNFTKHSPIGKEFTDFNNRHKIINLPQFVNSYWDEKEKKERLKAYSGESSINYRVFVKGEVVEDGVSVFDLEEVRKCYNEKKELKRFEIPKDKFEHFRSFIILERPRNADSILIASDVGDGRGGSEIIIVSKVGDKYNFLFRISLYNLKYEQQLEIFKYIIEKLEANVIAIDCGEALGRTLADNFEKIYSEENVVRYAGNSKINVEPKRDEKGNVIVKDGKVVYRQEFMSEWSVARLKVLLYNQRCNIPMDYQFDTQFNGVISTRSGTRTVYACLEGDDDHLFNACRVFAIAEWLKHLPDNTPRMSVEWGSGVSSWREKKEIYSNCQKGG